MKNFAKLALGAGALMLAISSVSFADDGIGYGRGFAGQKGLDGWGLGRGYADQKGWGDGVGLGRLDGRDGYMRDGFGRGFAGQKGGYFGKAGQFGRIGLAGQKGLGIIK